MTDLEITKLCAEAMGFDYSDAMHMHFEDGPTARGYFKYDPLQDNSQAMELMKKYGVHCGRGDLGEWHAELWMDLGNRWHGGILRNLISGVDNDLNRAICECIAKMQLAKANRGS